MTTIRENNDERMIYDPFFTVKLYIKSMLVVVGNYAMLLFMHDVMGHLLACLFRGNAEYKFNWNLSSTH